VQSLVDDKAIMNDESLEQDWVHAMKKQQHSKQQVAIASLIKCRLLVPHRHKISNYTQIAETSSLHHNKF
jgi:hypothetical protein